VHAPLVLRPAAGAGPQDDDLTIAPLDGAAVERSPFAAAFMDLFVFAPEVRR